MVLLLISISCTPSGVVTTTCAAGQCDETNGLPQFYDGWPQLASVYLSCSPDPNCIQHKTWLKTLQTTRLPDC